MGWKLCVYCLAHTPRAFYDRPVGRRPGLNGSVFSRRLFGRGCKCLTSNHLQPRLFSWLFSHGCRPTGSQSPFQKYSKCQGRGQGGSNFFIQFLEVSTLFELIFFSNSFLLKFFPEVPEFLHID